MKIAILSDIHGNHIALEAVLKEVSKIGINKLFILGDLVDYYYHPDKVLKLLDGWNKVVIRGNHEDYLLQTLKDKTKIPYFKQKFGSGLEMALKKLSRKQINFLGKLPEKKLLKIKGKKILICHGSPWDNNQYIYPDSDKLLFEKCLEQKVDYIFLGHTHYPFITTLKNLTIANPGSVGQARDKGGMASWLIFDTDNFSLVFKHTNFESQKIIEEVKRTDPQNEYLYKVLQR